MSEQLETFSTISQELLLEPSNVLRAYESMRIARECDDYELQLIRQGTARFQIGGRGAEISALLALFTQQGDTFHLHWRDRAMRLSVGISLGSMVDCFFGFESESSTDRHLVNHDFDRKSLVFPIVTPAAAHCLPACGVAAALTPSGARNVSICSLGDGSSRQGEFLEAVAYSIENKQPILWLVLDNQLATSTPTDGRTAIDLLFRSACRTIQGHHIFDCLRTFGHVIREVRVTSQPQMIRLYVPRLGSHTSHDNESLYRSKEQLQSAALNDPLHHFRVWVVQNRIIEETELEVLDERIRSTVREAYSHASQKWLERSGDLLTKFRTLGSRKESQSASEGTDRIADATRLMLDQILTTDRESLLIGEDVEDPLGGVFRLTKGLSTKHIGQVTNSPLAEATILGVAYGRALAGKRTIAEIQFMDFLAPAWNQLVSNICSHSWRTMEQWPLPIIIYTVAGAYSPGEGMFHSQVNASLLAKNKDLIVAYPSNPDDVRRVFGNALISEKPTFVILPKARLWDRQAKLRISSVEFSATVKCYGEDVTVVTWGNGVVLAEQASKIIPQVSVEIIDLCYLNPVDLETIRRSVIKTGRLIVVDEDSREFSVGSDLISRLVTDRECWSRLKTQLCLIARKSQYMPTSEIGERAVLPFPEDIASAISQIIHEE